jgi:DNA-binding MarR family transcriptional regulator
VLRAGIDSRLRAEHDLPLAKFEPMQIIAERGVCRVYDIAAELALTTGGTSKIVDAIEASGYCRRKPNPEDRRSSLIELTPAGQRVVVKASRTFEAELQARLGDGMSPRALAQLTSSLSKLRGSATLGEVAEA